VMILHTREGCHLQQNELRGGQLSAILWNLRILKYPAIEVVKWAVGNFIPR
jgi:hypothetical protein